MMNAMGGFKDLRFWRQEGAGGLLCTVCCVLCIVAWLRLSVRGCLFTKTALERVARLKLGDSSGWNNFSPNECRLLAGLHPTAPALTAAALSHLSSLDNAIYHLLDLTP